MLKIVVYQEGTLDWWGGAVLGKRDPTPNRNGGT